MNKSQVILIGSSGHAKVVMDIFERSGTYDILGILDPFRATGEKVYGYEVLGSEEDLPQLMKKWPSCLLFIGLGDNWKRKKIHENIQRMYTDISYAIAIHPSAQIAKGVQIGEGTAIMAGAVINSDTRIGRFCIVNSRTSIDHDSHLANFASAAPGVTTGGNVSIGEYSAISIGATLKHGINVGAHTILGAGSLLLENTGNQEIWYGVPAKLKRKREIGETYL